MIPISAYLALALILFCIGLYGALTKRNTVIVLIWIELMLNAVNINLVAFSKLGIAASIDGQIFALFVMAVAAAEAAVGLAILMALYRNRKTVNIDEMNTLKTRNRGTVLLFLETSRTVPLFSKGDLIGMESAWMIPLFPLLSFLFLLIFGKRLKEASSYIASLLALASFVYTLLVLFDRFTAPTYKAEATWLEIGSIQLTVGFEVNQLNALMLVIVSLVSFLVHIYSAGYMKGDDRISVYYAYLGLFTFAMLGLVLSPNLLQTYMFWELVGLGSFLLIGFYFYKEEAKAAAKKAFIMTRIGDIGLLIGMILLFWQVGSFEYDAIFQAIDDGVLSSGMITLTAILIFIGAVGKSGQFPLHSWLPDAMEGPTPVSALIHAATMVAAGVYLVATVYPLFLASEAALMTIAVVGAVTAIFAASIALVQKDIKRVLAYSTISQLGYMMLALGSAGYVAGVFHLTTHAFFKALLFLAAGSVIHAVHTQEYGENGRALEKASCNRSIIFNWNLSD